MILEREIDSIIAATLAAPEGEGGLAPVSLPAQATPALAPAEETREGVCPFCLAPAHAKMCAPQRALLGSRVMNADEMAAHALNRVAELMGELDQAHQHVGALIAKEEAARAELDNVASYLASEIESMDCSAGNFDGGSAWTCEHCQLVEWMNKIDALTADSEPTAHAARAWLRRGE